jgi:DNA repair protein RadC
MDRAKNITIRKALEPYYDIQLTRKLKEAGLMLDLPVLDHLIISSEGYYSFADEGLL